MTESRPETTGAPAPSNAASGGAEASFVLDAVTKRYGDSPPAVNELSLTIPAGQITVLVGPSGCGKTTTLRMLNRMVEPTSGTVTFQGEPIRHFRRTALRRRMGYVIQNGGLLPHRTVADNIATVPRLIGWDRARTRRRVAELLDDVGLPRSLAQRHPAELSGGQQQRVGVARALAAEPEVLLMDEPFSAVDPLVRAGLQDLLRQLQAERPRTVVMITHDIDEAIRLGDRVVLLDHGARIAQNATPQEILNDPADDFVAAFVGRDRGWRTLSFHPAADLPVERVRAVRTPGAARAGTRAVVLDSSARPIGWVTPERPGKVINLGGTFDPVRDSLRAALDAALASPVGFAVAVQPDTGRFTGAVSLETIMKHAAELRRTVSIDVLDAKEAEARRKVAEARREAAERARRQEAERARLLAEIAVPSGPSRRRGTTSGASAAATAASASAPATPTSIPAETGRSASEVREPKPAATPPTDTTSVPAEAGGAASQVSEPNPADTRAAALASTDTSATDTSSADTTVADTTEAAVEAGAPASEASVAQPSDVPSEEPPADLPTRPDEPTEAEQSFFDSIFETDVIAEDVAEPASEEPGAGAVQPDEAGRS